MTSPDVPEPPDTAAPDDAAGPVLAPDDIDPVDHTVDAAIVDGDEAAIPGEWL